MRPALSILLFVASTGVVFAQRAEFVREYCVPCHNARYSEANIQFDSLDLNHPDAARDTWERVLRQLRARTMPPTDNPRPDAKTYDSLIAGLVADLDHSPRDQPRAIDTQGATRLSTLHDPSALVRDFFDPWLGLHQLESIEADPAAFPEFDAPMRKAMLRETELFIESQLRDDRPVTELWTANYTYVNDRLAKHYGIANVTGPEFRRVSLLTADRAGLLGHASILTLTSVLTKHTAVDAPSTSPAARAKWIRNHFLGVPAPNPIPNIPPQRKGILLSTQLRALPDPSCNACHSNFFPMGYALENFDPLGRWRMGAENDEIDVSGEMVDGTAFDGPAELRRALLQHQDAFQMTIAERLVSYALDGKDAISQRTPADRMPAVRAIVREATTERFTWSSLIAAIARSDLFQTK